MICELVDNALDAAAERVWIELGRRSVTVADDNGCGIADIDDAIRFGKGSRLARGSGVLGRYGVGMTDALGRLGPNARSTRSRRSPPPRSVVTRSRGARIGVGQAKEAAFEVREPPYDQSPGDPRLERP